MGTLIKIKNADFSQNNIGNFADYTGFTSRTLAYRDAANFGLSSEQQLKFTELNALNDLDVAITGLGLWTKIKTFHPFKGSVNQTLKLNFKDESINHIAIASRGDNGFITPKVWLIDSFQQTFADQKNFGFIFNQNSISDFVAKGAGRRFIAGGNELNLWQTSPFSDTESNFYNSDQDALYTQSGNSILLSTKYRSIQANGLVGFFSQPSTQKVFYNDGTSQTTNYNNSFISTSDKYPNNINIGNTSIDQTISMLMFTDGSISDSEYANLRTAINTYLDAVGELIP